MFLRYSILLLAFAWRILTCLVSLAIKMQMNLESCLGLYDVLLHLLKEINYCEEFISIQITVNCFHMIKYILLDHITLEAWKLLGL